MPPCTRLPAIQVCRVSSGVIVRGDSQDAGTASATLTGLAPKHAMSHIAIWLIAASTITGILLRPRGWSEAVWACLGASLLILLRLLPAEQALSAVRKGADVYLFLTGMMLLAELARRERLFDWLAHTPSSPQKDHKYDCSRLYTEWASS
jgi:hypothetical protein